MPSATISATANIGGISFPSIISRTNDGQIGHEVTLAAAAAGTLSTRTNNTDGTLTLGSGHGVETGDTIDIYWEGGRRYNVTVGTVSGTSVPISGGAGDNLPILDSAVTADVAQELDIDFDGDLMTMLGVMGDKRGGATFFDASDNVLARIDLAAKELYQWVAGGPHANPLTGNPVDAVTISNADSAYTNPIRIGVLYDSAS